MNTHQEILLRAMGIGPIWKLRQNAQLTDALVQAPLSLQAERELPTPETQASLDADLARCPVCGFSGAHAVTGPGMQPIRSDYLFVAQSSDADEPGQGAVLNGAGAVLLANMLRALGVQNGDKAQLVNLVQSRPANTQTGERSGDADACFLCLACLKLQVEALQPSMLIALGQTAGASLLGLNASVPAAGLRGQLHEYHGKPMLVTYHPDYLLRRPKEKSGAWSDLCLAMQTLAKG